MTTPLLESGPHTNSGARDPGQAALPPWVFAQPQITNKNEWRAWMRRVENPLKRPQRLTRRQRERLDRADREAYDVARLTYHSRFGPVRHCDFEAIQDAVLRLADDNLLARSPTAWPSALIDGQVSLGKTTLALHIGHRYEQLMRRHYDVVDALLHDDYVPVIYVTLDGEVTVKGLNRQLATFYGPPRSSARNGEDYRYLVLECARRCGTTLIIVDDIHNLLPRAKNHAAVSGDLKRLMNELPATFLYVGVDCTLLLNEGRMADELYLAQNSSRVHVYSLGRYSRNTPEDRRVWASLIATFANELVLADPPTDLWRKHAAYLHLRTGGQMNALQLLLRGAANAAIRDGVEKIDRRLLDSILLPSTAETQARAAGFRPLPGTRNERIDRRSQAPSAR
jgi:hypothetical protein